MTALLFLGSADCPLHWNLNANLLASVDLQRTKKTKRNTSNNTEIIMSSSEPLDYKSGRSDWGGENGNSFDDATVFDNFDWMHDSEDDDVNFASSSGAFNNDGDNGDNMNANKGMEDSIASWNTHESHNDNDEYNVSLGSSSSEPRKTIRFASQIATPMEGCSGFLDAAGIQNSTHSIDIFNDEGGNTSRLNLDGSGSTQSSLHDEDDDEDSSFASAVSEEEDEETKIKRKMVYALGGLGVFALIGFGLKKLMNAFSKNDDIEGGADITNVADATDAATNINDVASLGVGGGDGGSSAATAAATEAANEAAFHASASQSQNGFGAFGMAGNQGGAGMSAAQTQVLQSMAVNAATNAASSAASASSALASTAAAAAGAGAAAAAGAGAVTVATFSTVVSLFRFFFFCISALQEI